MNHHDFINVFSITLEGMDTVHLLWAFWRIITATVCVVCTYCSSERWIILLLLDYLILSAKEDYNIKDGYPNSYDKVAIKVMNKVKRSNRQAGLQSAITILINKLYKLFETTETRHPLVHQTIVLHSNFNRFLILLSSLV